MAVQDILIPTRTTIEKNGDISINVRYAPDAEEFLEFFVALIDGVLRSVQFQAGDLGYEIENLSDIFEINSDGELIVLSQDPTVYSINNAGDLILTPA